MNELVKTNRNGRDITTSLLVAEVFGKEHKNVLRDIMEMDCSPRFRELNFELSFYISQQNKELPMYELTKDGFSFLAMGYTGAKAAEFKERFINEFNRREMLLKSEDYILARSQEILTNRVKSLQEKVEQKNEIIKALEPKAIFADSVTASKDSILVSELAKVLKQNGIEIGQNRLFAWLRQFGYLCSKGEYYNQPTQKSMELGLFEIKKTTINRPNAEPIVSSTTKVTGKGQIYLVNKFVKSSNQILTNQD